MAGVTNELIYEALLKIDEDIADLHAVCRLMNWAGMLGLPVRSL